jgi:hypothetical protein
VEGGAMKRWSIINTLKGLYDDGGLSVWHISQELNVNIHLTIRFWKCGCCSSSLEWLKVIFQVDKGKEYYYTNVHGYRFFVGSKVNEHEGVFSEIS